MPAALLSKQEVLDRLLETFRERGYDGASLAELSTATGLGRSSLYHHFPGGKEDMARQVFAHLEAQLTAAVFEPMRGPGRPAQKLARMIEVIDAFYAGGKKACLLERMCASVDSSQFRRPLQRAFAALIEAVQGVAVEAGLSRALARARAEDFVIRVEGALVVCAGTGDTKVFARTLEDLRRTTLSPA